MCNPCWLSLSSNLTQSFRRATGVGTGASPAGAALPGVREWMYGQRLVSTGHAVLDAIVSGGVLLGSLSIIDSWSGVSADGHIASLSALFAAQGRESGNRVVVVAADGSGVASGAGFAATLPQTAGTSSTSSSTSRPALTPSTSSALAPSSLASLAPPSPSSAADAGADADGSNLKIAWQYKKYLGDQGTGKGSLLTAAGAASSSVASAVPPSTTAAPPAPRSTSTATPPAAPSAASSAYCHTFDLARVSAHTGSPPSAAVFPGDADSVDLASMPQLVVVRPALPPPVPGDPSGTSAWTAASSRILRVLTAIVNGCDGKQVVRLLVFSPWGPLWGSPSPRDLLQFLHAVRGIVRGRTAVAWVTLPSYRMPPVVVTRALHVAQYSVRVDAFKGALAGCSVFVTLAVFPSVRCSVSCAVLAV